MLSTLMRTTSALALTLSLAAPQPLLAQEGERRCPDGSAPVEAEGSDTPVCPADVPAAAPEALTEPPDAAPAEAAGAPAAAPEATPEAPAEAAEAPAAAEPPTEEAEALPPTDGSAGAAADAETSQQATTDADQPVPEGGAAAGTAAEGDAQPVEETDTPAPAQAAQETPPTPEESAEPTEQAVEETDAPAAEPADAAEAEGSTTTADAPTEEPVEGTGEGADGASTGGQADTGATGTATADAPTEEPVERTGEGADGASGQAASGETTAPQQNAAEDAQTAADAAPDAQAEVAQDDTAESAAEANAPVAAQAGQAATDETVAPGDEVVETVTEETSRSSGEEFETAVQRTEEDDDGLSRFGTFALGALGGAAVATLLNRDEEVVMSSQDRLVVQDKDGSYRVLKNDDALLRRPGVEVATREFSDGSTRTIVTRQDGTQVVTIRAADGQVLRRTRILADGREVVLFDDTREFAPVDVASIRDVQPAETVTATGEDELRAALAALENPTDRQFSLRQIRQIRAVRELVPEIDLDSVNFESGSAVIHEEEAGDLRSIGRAMADAIDENPNEVFLIEGHTDAVGGAGMNLALSDRRAESVALALAEYFDIPPENMVVQGYGESNLRVRTQEAERANRRVAIRKITPLLYTQAN